MTGKKLGRDVLNQMLGHWSVMTDDFYAMGCSNLAASHLAQQIEENIRQSGEEKRFAVVSIHPDEGRVVVLCTAEFGAALGNLPSARYAEVVNHAPLKLEPLPDDVMPVLRVSQASKAPAKSPFKPK